MAITKKKKGKRKNVKKQVKKKTKAKDIKEYISCLRQLHKLQGALLTELDKCLLPEGLKD